MIIKPNKDKKKRQLISPDDFYSNEKEKIKLNWFCFEYALEYQMFINMDQKLKSILRRKKIDDMAIAGFCIYFSKYMKKSTLNMLNGLSQNIVVNYHEIEKYFPSLNNYYLNRLLKLAGKAWDFMIRLCASCPVQCLSEKDKKSLMFDDPLYRE